MGLERLNLCTLRQPFEFLRIAIDILPNFCRSLVIDHLQEATSRGPEPLAYFYCVRNPAELERANVEEILYSILRQLLSQAPSLAAWELVQHKHGELKREYGSQPRKLTLDESKDSILDMIKIYPSMTIIIDALDECDPKTRPLLLEALKDITSRSPAKILISSRDDNDLDSQTSESLHLHIRDTDNSDDIKQYICYQVEESIRNKILLRGKISAELKQHIVTTLTEGAQGM